MTEASSEMKTGRERKIYVVIGDISVALCPLHIQHSVTWDRTRATE
jgi:hypothetical protein